MRIGLTRSQFVRALKGKLRMKGDIGKEGVVYGVEDDGTLNRVTEIKIIDKGIIKLLTKIRKDGLFYSRYVIALRERRRKDE